VKKDPIIQSILPELIDIRRKIHQNPELSWQEFKTTELIKTVLEGWGLNFQPFKTLKTGGYCDVGEGKTLVYRSDIDALPVMEDLDHAIRSQNKYIMHACGHDFHTAIGLGLLRYFQLSPVKNVFKLRVVFQPAEEAYPTGADSVIKEDILENVKTILAAHVHCEIPIGKIGFSRGASNASSTSVQITFKGPGGHTSRPQETIDLIPITATFIYQIQKFLKEHINQNEIFVLAFGEIHGGNAHNVIPQVVTLKGTLRTFSPQTSERISELIRNLACQFENEKKCKITVEFPTNCPPVINNLKLCDQMIEFMRKNSTLDQLIILPKPSMGADDFSYYLTKAPGLYFYIGGGGKGKLHSGELELDESLLEVALNYLTGFIPII